MWNLSCVRAAFLKLALIMAMIESLVGLSKRLFWMKPIIFLIGIGFFGLFLYTLLSTNAIEKDVYLIPSVLGTIWSLLFMSLVSMFSNVPSKPVPSEVFFTKLKIRFKRGLYHCLGALFIVLTIAVIVLSIKMFGVWRADY